MNFKNKNLNSVLSSSLVPIIFSILCRIYYYNIYLYSEYTDTITYINAGNNLLKGNIDPMRTPVYPLFLQICIKLFSLTYMGVGVVLIQNIALIFSIFFFYKICKHFIKSELIVCLACIAYGCIPSIVNWEFCALTETFSIVSIVIFTYLIISYLEKKSYKYLIITSFFMFFMVMLKPAFLVIYAIFIGFLILNFILTKQERRKMLLGFISAVISLSLVMGYVEINKYQNNVNEISMVTDLNNFANIVEAGLYKNGSDEELIQSVNDLISNGETPVRAAYEVELKYRSYNPVNRIGNFNNEILSKYRINYLSYTFLKFKDVYDSPISIKYADLSEKFKDKILTSDLLDLNINFYSVYFLLIIELVVILLSWIKKKIVPWGNIGIFSIILLQIIASIAFAQGEYPRLVSPILPLLIVIIFKDVDMIIRQTPSAT